MRWFRALLPKEERFFDLFEDHSKTLIEGAAALRALLEGGGNNVAASFDAIAAQETRADELTREVMLAVRRTMEMTTPFDRGDIQGLIQAMDDAIDQMHKTSKDVVLFEFTAFTPQMREIADAAIECASIVAQATPLLRNMSANALVISELCERVTQIEERADRLYDAGRKELYQACAADPRGFFVGSEIYRHLEKVVDKFEDVANTMQSIVVEHA